MKTFKQHLTTPTYSCPQGEKGWARNSDIGAGSGY